MSRLGFRCPCVGGRRNNVFVKTKNCRCVCFSLRVTWEQLGCACSSPQATYQFSLCAPTNAFTQFLLNISPPNKRTETQSFFLHYRRNRTAGTDPAKLQASQLPAGRPPFLGRRRETKQQRHDVAAKDSADFSSARWRKTFDWQVTRQPFDPLPCCRNEVFLATKFARTDDNVIVSCWNFKVTL